jgi:hypothetical protein
MAPAHAEPEPRSESLVRISFDGQDHFRAVPGRIVIAGRRADRFGTSDPSDATRGGRTVVGRLARTLPRRQERGRSSQHLAAEAQIPYCLPSGFPYLHLVRSPLKPGRSSTANISSFCTRRDLGERRSCALLAQIARIPGHGGTPKWHNPWAQRTKSPPIYPCLSPGTGAALTPTRAERTPPSPPMVDRRQPVTSCG